MTKRISVLMCVAALSGCGGKSSNYQAKVKADEPKLEEGLTRENVFPLSVGNQWVYAAEQVVMGPNGQGGSQKAEVAWKVTDVKDTPSGKRAVIEVRSGGKTVDRQVWELNSKGLYQISVGSDKPRPFSPPMPVLEFPATEGLKFTWKGTAIGSDNKPAAVSSVSTVQPVRAADTARDPIAAIPIESVMTYGKDGSTATTTAFFAPKVGMVRLVTRIRTPRGDSDSKLVLKSFRSVKSK